MKKVISRIFSLIMLIGLITALVYIYNKYYFNSVSQLILKNLFKNTFKIHTIFYRKKLKNLTKQIQKNKNIKLNKNIEIKIKKY